MKTAQLKMSRAKSFHLRSLYQQHGFKEHNKAYRFFKNLYEYDEREAFLLGKGKFDKASGQRLNGNQQIFRRTDNTYFYRTHEKQVGEVSQPLRLSKNFRLTTNLNPGGLVKLAKKQRKKPALELTFGRRKNRILTHDFQEFLITSLLSFCQKAEFSKIPLEAEQVPKEGGSCDKSVFSHFQTKSVLNFTFAPEQAELAHRFFANLDAYTEEYEAIEAKDFFNPRITDPGEILFISPPKKEKAQRKVMKNTPEKLICSHCGRGIRPGYEEQCDSGNADLPSKSRGGLDTKQPAKPNIFILPNYAKSNRNLKEIHSNLEVNKAKLTSNFSPGRSFNISPFTPPEPKLKNPSIRNFPKFEPEIEIIINEPPELSPTTNQENFSATVPLKQPPNSFDPEQYLAQFRARLSGGDQEHEEE
ncbi:4117_t:CDS:2, partial [Racocetra persica]